MKIVEIGHTSRSPGAIGYDGITEYQRNHDLAKRIMFWMNYFRCHTDILEGSTMGIKGVDSEMALRNVVQKLNNKPKGSNFTSIHFNNNHPRASGTEVFVSTKSSIQNKKRAEWMVYHISNIIGIPMRTSTPSRLYKYSKESYLGKLALLDDVINIEGLIYEVCFQNQNDISRYAGKENHVAYILALGTIHDFKHKNEPQYKLTTVYDKLESIKPKLI